MDETKNWENEIQEYFQVKKISDDGAFVINTPVKVDGDSLDLYLFEADGEYLLTDYGRFLKTYLSDEQSEEEYRKSAQKAGFDLVGREIVKYIFDKEDIIEAIFEVLNWCLSEKTRILEERIRIARSEDKKITEDEKTTNAFVKITGLCVAVVFSFLVVGFVTVLCSLIKVIGVLF